MSSVRANGAFTIRSNLSCAEATMFWKWFKRQSRPRSALMRCEGYRVDLPGLGEMPVSMRIDCIGASCPRPQMLAIKALEQVGEGEIIELISDNPSSVESLGSLMEVLGSTHAATIKEKTQWRIYLRKGLVTPIKQ
ncbi:MAG: sulfurtransferase TusA family protein [Candidatus Thiodiazotropha sp.]